MVVIDALTRREWVREDYVPHHEGGVRDPQVRAVGILGIFGVLEPQSPGRRAGPPGARF